MTFLAGNDDFQVVHAVPAAFLSEETREREVAKLADRVIETIESGKHPVLTTEQSESVREKLNRWGSGKRPRRGDNAYKICRELDAVGLKIISEVETGIPLTL